MTAKQLLLLLPIKDREQILQMMKKACEDVGDCNGIVEAEGAYKNAINIIKESTLWDKWEEVPSYLRKKFVRDVARYNKLLAEGKIKRLTLNDEIMNNLLEDYLIRRNENNG
jgi:hypothetical protein